MELDQGKQVVLDARLEAFGGHLRAAGDERAAVTLAYTHNLHRAWRTALRMLPVPAGISVLDVGSGLGVLAFELAAQQALDVHGVDLDPGFVAHSEELLGLLDEDGVFAPGASARFHQGDAYELPFGDGSFDLVFARELLQFVPDPVRALAEMSRVLRPGGAVCVSDTDDQLRVTWPGPSPALARLVAAVSDVQHARGGDRHCGRKLSTYVRRAGLDLGSVVVLPEAQHRTVDAGEGERALVLRQLQSARGRVVEAGAMTAEGFDADLAELAAEEEHDEFRMNARIIVLGLKPVAMVKVA